ncbi:MAG: hypothetical protein D6812_03925 [Deltaproteobacteria bacterium]|nr:MAG: hypothetical protein D6812_03925 [Deltaproteobacteria bacterium]
MIEPIREERKARRLARAIISDIAIYNEKKIQTGIENDNLFDLLKDELEEGRSLYETRVAAELRECTNFFNEALCDILVFPQGKIESEIW